MPEYFQTDNNLLFVAALISFEIDSIITNIARVYRQFPPEGFFPT